MRPPSSLEKEGTNGCTPLHSHIMQTITTQLNTTHYNPSQGLHIDSTIESKYRVKVGSLREENFKSMNHIYSHILISNIPFQGLTMSSLFMYFLIPPKNASNHEVHTPLKHIKIISIDRRVLQLHGWAQLSPSSKHLFPPKGEWCFTPILHKKVTWTKQD